jgi:4-amino-4-deoxychorismate lyase
MILFESIKIIDGKSFFLIYHQERINRTLKALFAQYSFFDLEDILKDKPTKGIYRCKFSYNNTSYKIEYFPLSPLVVESLELVFASIDYRYKYSNRDEINFLYTQRKKADDILIVKDNYLTDTSIANICLYDNEKWYTPKKPLLYGTTRERLIDDKRIFPINISPKDIDYFSKVAIINALRGFVILKYGIINKN